MQISDHNMLWIKPCIFQHMGFCMLRYFNVKSGSMSGQSFVQRFLTFWAISAILPLGIPLDYYANIYSNVVEKPDDRHEKASDDLRKMGVKIKAFAKEERPENTDVPSVIELEDAAEEERQRYARLLLSFHRSPR